ncbi:hypothetical protein [Halarchaeum sp. P4]|uniref:hypothetical protein n=1 Tax=Halarchaeum sp. P4 TaxID=3421639 RepID=UPI003EBCF4CA
MVPDPSTTTRRALLAGVGAGITVALAGCSASETHRSVSPEGGTLVTDYSVAMTRTTGKHPPVVAPREDDGDDRTATTTADSLRLHTVESQSDAASFEFADDATNTAAVRRLLSETDYANESVVVHQTRVRECYRPKLNYVARDTDGDPNVEFCQVVRDAHTACERRSYDFTAAFVRLPFPGDSYGSYSVGGGGDCNRVPDRYRNASGRTNGSESA